MEYYLLPVKEGEEAIAVEDVLKKVDYDLYLSLFSCTFF